MKNVHSNARLTEQKRPPYEAITDEQAFPMSIEPQLSLLLSWTWRTGSQSHSCFRLYHTRPTRQVYCHPHLPFWLTYQLCIHITTDAPTYPLTYPPSNWCSHLPSDAPIYLLMYPPNYYTQDYPTCWLIHPHNNWHTFLSTNIPTYRYTRLSTDLLTYPLSEPSTQPTDIPLQSTHIHIHLPTDGTVYLLVLMLICRLKILSNTGMDPDCHLNCWLHTHIHTHRKKPIHEFSNFLTQIIVTDTIRNK